MLLLTLLLPLAGGGLMPFLKIRSRAARMVYAMLVTCAGSALALVSVLSGGSEEITLFRLTDTLAFVLRPDGAGRIYLSIAAVLWPFAVLYAVGYMRHEEREGNFFAWYILTFASAVVIGFAGNLFTLYVGYEFMTLFTLPLVWHARNKESIRAVRQYMLYLFSGAALGFVCLIGLDMSGAGAFLPGGTRVADGVFPRVLCMLGFFGFAVKAAVFPLCCWLPKASVAPTPVTALLHAAAVVNAGVFAVTRLFYYTVPPGLLRGTWVQFTALACSAFTVVYAGVRAVREMHLKRRLAWSTVSNLSYMLTGVMLLTADGFVGGMAHMVFHSLMKIILFFCAGTVMVQTGRTQIRQMHGLGTKMPLTFGAFMLAGAALTGVPPLAGFVSKYAIVTAAFSAGGFFAVTGGIALLVAAVLTAVYIMTAAFPAFFMKPVVTDGAELHEGDWTMSVSVALLCVLLVAVSFCAGPVMSYIASVAGGLGI